MKSHYENLSKVVTGFRLGFNRIILSTILKIGVGRKDKTERLIKETIIQAKEDAVGKVRSSWILKRF